MSHSLPMVVTDGRVLLGSEIEDVPGVAVIPRDVRIRGETMCSDERANVIRSVARDAIEQGRSPEVLAPDRARFLETYLRLAESQSHVISVHYLQGLDAAAREARICRQLMQPLQLIDVYEAKTLEGGLDFLLRCAAALAAEGASAGQVLALLRYLETHMLTLLLTPGPAVRRSWALPTSAQQLVSLAPAIETLWHFDPKQQAILVVEQERKLHARLGEILQSRWGRLRYAAIVRYRGYRRDQMDALAASLARAGLPEAARVEPVAATFLPYAARPFAEILLVPTEADLARLQKLVQDPIWWKGDA